MPGPQVQGPSPLPWLEPLLLILGSLIAAGATRVNSQFHYYQKIEKTITQKAKNERKEELLIFSSLVTITQRYSVSLQLACSHPDLCIVFVPVKHLKKCKFFFLISQMVVQVPKHLPICFYTHLSLSLSQLENVDFSVALTAQQKRKGKEKLNCKSFCSR